MLDEGLASHREMGSCWVRDWLHTERWGHVGRGTGFTQKDGVTLGEGLASHGEVGSCWVRDWLHTERWGHVG